MEIVRSSGDDERLAPVFGMSPADLRARHGASARTLGRWVATVAGDPIEAVTTGSMRTHGWPRPQRAIRGGNLYASRNSDDADLLGALVAAGFVPEMEAERFQIRFDRALAWLARARVPSTFRVEPANRVDVDRLVALDNIIRNDVPGTDGWNADRSWIIDELSEALPFDASAYLVAICEPVDEYAGLVRVWRNPAGPRLGLVGVTRSYRRTILAAGLLRRSILAASEWGHDTFVTETSLSNRVIHPRLHRLGAVSRGRVIQLVRRHPGGRRGYGTISTGHGE